MCRRLARGFTLIELMIVVSIIAIIASISIPSLLRSRMAANEASAISSLRTICTMQSAFRRTDFNIPGYPVGVHSYARPYFHLYNYIAPYTAPQFTLGFIDRDLATAHFLYPILADRDAKAGYQFCDLSGGINSAMVPYNFNPTMRFGMTASPLSYNLSGVNSFLMTDTGVIYQRDLSTSAFAGWMYDDPILFGYITVE